MRFSYRLANLDWSRVALNALIFTAPAALLYLLTVQAALANGFDASDFAITREVKGGIATYVIGVLIDFFRKFKAVE